MNTANNTQSYNTRTLASVSKDHLVTAGYRGVRIIRKNEKDANGNVTERESLYVEIPRMTDNFVQTFIANEKGLQLVREYVESLQDKVCRVVTCDKNRSVCDADLTIDELIAIGEATSDNVRITKELIGKLFDTEWRNRIAYALVLERDIEGTAALEQDAAGFWNTAKGEQFLALASNYKQFLLRAAERNPSFESEAVKSKVLAAVGYLDSDVIVDKVADKLQNAPVATADMIAL